MGPCKEKSIVFNEIKNCCLCSFIAIENKNTKKSHYMYSNIITWMVKITNSLQSIVIQLKLNSNSQYYELPFLLVHFVLVWFSFQIYKKSFKSLVAMCFYFLMKVLLVLTYTILIKTLNVMLNVLWSVAISSLVK